MKRSILVSVLALFTFVQTLSAKIKLPAIVSSNMVLQRNSDVVVWGTANPKEKITITTSWLDEKIKVVADSNGKWATEVTTTNSKEQQSITLESKESSIELENILFGEVWLCSGQSNMQQPVNGYAGQPSFGANDAIINGANESLRLFTVHRKGSKQPLSDVEKYDSWASASLENIPEFSAVAYYYGAQLQKTLDVPVGMIHTSWGGSSVQAWVSDEVLSTHLDFDIEKYNIEKGTNRIPTALYNAMISPLIPYTIKGALWYQGESNRMEPTVYETLFPAMVKDWRTRWNQGDFPFYYVQIAPYMYGGNAVFNKVENSAFIREAQLNCLSLIPNSGIAITMDIGDDYCIHPPKKKEVADRLLYNALELTYGIKTIDGQSPMYKSHEVKEDKVILKFDHAEAGLFAYDELYGFEVAGADHVFYPAKARIVKRSQVEVSSAKVASPLAVRYAWKNFINGCLFDNHLLPAPSFRTDDWEEAVRAK